MVVSQQKWELDTQAYLNVCNITAELPRQQIRDFSKRVNDLGLWNSMVCWPLRSSQNAGVGLTAYSLGGLGRFDGTLVGGPTWGADGISFGGNTQYIEYSPQFNVNFTLGGYSVHAVWSGLGVSVVSGEGSFLLFASPSGEIQNVATTGVGGGTTWMPQSRNYNGNRYASIFSNLSISGNVGFGWNADTLTLQTNGANVTTAPTASSTPTNGNYTIRTTGRNNTTAPATSRISYLMAFTPNIGMTTLTMTAIYDLAKQTLGQGLSLP